MTLVLDSPKLKTDWLCEKWSEEACDFARKKFDKLGISRLPGHAIPKVVGDSIVTVPALVPIEDAVPSWALRSLVGDPEEVMEIHGNLLLNEGIQRLMDMTMIATVVSNQVTANPWSNANAFIGVGDSSTAEAATQTELQAASNRFYKAMNATYPSRVNQTSSFQSDFVTAEANYPWQEWTISAGASTASGGGFTTGGINLNRKVASLGTKTTGTWTLTAQITLS